MIRSLIHPRASITTLILLCFFSYSSAIIAEDISSDIDQEIERKIEEMRAQLYEQKRAEEKKALKQKDAYNGSKNYKLGNRIVGLGFSGKTDLFSLYYGYFFQSGENVGLEFGINAAFSTSRTLLKRDDDEFFSSTTQFGIGPKFLIRVPIHDRLSYTPSIGFGFERAKTVDDAPGIQVDRTISGFSISAAPVSLNFRTGPIELEGALQIGWNFGSLTETEKIGTDEDKLTVTSRIFAMRSLFGIRYRF